MYFAPFEKNLAVWTGIFVKKLCGIKLQIEILLLLRSFLKFLEFLSVATWPKEGSENSPEIPTSNNIFLIPGLSNYKLS